VENKKIIKYDMNSKKFPFKNGDLVGHVCWEHNKNRFCLERNGIRYWSLNLITNSKKKTGIMLLTHRGGFSMERNMFIYPTKEMHEEDVYHKIE